MFCSPRLHYNTTHTSLVRRLIGHVDIEFGQVFHKIRKFDGQFFLFILVYWKVDLPESLLGIQSDKQKQAKMDLRCIIPKKTN